MADAKVVLDADTAPINRKLDQTRGKVGGIGKEVEQMAKGWVKSVVGITAIVGVLKKLDASMEASRQKREELGRQFGQRQMTAGVAMAQLPIPSDGRDGFLSAINSAPDRDAAIAFLTEQAGKTKAERRRMRPDALLRAAMAAGSMVYSKDQVEEIFKGKLAFNPGAAAASLPQSARDELEARKRERAQEIATESVQAMDRETSANLERQRNASPGLDTLLDVVPGAERYARWRIEGDTDRRSSMTQRTDRLAEEARDARERDAARVEYARDPAAYTQDARSFFDLLLNRPIKTIPARPRPQIGSQNER